MPELRGDRDAVPEAELLDWLITKPDATPFRDATKSVYEEFYASPAGKDARKIVDHILSIK